MDHRTTTVFSLQQPVPPPRSPLPKLVLVASIAAGVQFGWALQLSLLTPYVQLLGIPHKWASLIWLCGPISGMLVQPIVGFHSDNCTSPFGRRRPFIAAGALMVAVAVVLIGYAADLGHRFGDDPRADTKPRAVIIFVVGFWILDVANNTLQGPCRALLADLSGNDRRRMRMSNSLFSFFMAVGNVLGFAAGSYTHLHRIFPFTGTTACDVYCANLKSCFFFSILLLFILTVVALALIREEQWSPEPVSDEGVVTGGAAAATEGGLPFFAEIFRALKELKKPMRVLLMVTCLNWIAWFPFLLFDTDWMGREVYGGASQGSSTELKQLYNNGVRAGALGLMVNSVVLGLTSLVVEPAARVVGGVKRLWGILNFWLALCLAMTVLVTKLAESDREFTTVKGFQVPLPPSNAIRGGALALFAALGVPLAITYSIPFAMASIYSSTSGAGQGLSLGVLNLAIVVPQIVVSLGSGPFDVMFGGGNLPAFLLGGAAAMASGVLALTMLPSPPPDRAKTLTFGTHV